MSRPAVVCRLSLKDIKPLGYEAIGIGLGE